MLNPFWTSPSISRMGSNARSMNSIAPLTTPYCASTVASMAHHHHHHTPMNSYLQEAIPNTSS